MLPVLQTRKSSAGLFKFIKSERLLDEVYSRSIKKGSLKIIDAYGKVHLFGNRQAPFVTLSLKKPDLHYKISLNPELYIGEAYMEGDLKIEEGSLKDLFQILFINSNTKMPHKWLRLVEMGNFFLRRLQQLNTVANSSKNVSHHYDLPPDFYQLFLDEDKQYSCAYFTDDTQTLEQAQKNKIQLIVNKLLIKPGHRILDIGCGWGGLACAIARETGAKVTGISLSIEQIKVARERAVNEGVDKLVNFELRDYRHLYGGVSGKNSKTRFDRIVSVGMFEHVGIDHYPDFFKKIQQLLADDGVMLLHSIGRAQGPSSTNPWIRKYIFPGGYIPALSEVIPHVEKVGLHITDVEILRLHYARTLQEWRKRFFANIEKVREKYDEKFCRMWEFYLTGSEASFEYWGNMVFHLQLSTQPGAVPLTRDYLYSNQIGEEQ